MPIGPPKTNVLETEVDGDISLYDPESERVTVLNSSASDVWRLADGEHTFDEIVALLATAYGIDEDMIRQDVRQTVDEFVDARLIESP